MKRESESKIQAECYRWFTNEYGLKHHNPRMSMFSVPNELAMVLRGVLMDTRLPQNKIDQIIAILSQRLKNMGMRSGVSDTVVVLPNRTIYVEFKTPEGYQSDKQKEFQSAIQSCNQQYHIVRSLEQFKSIIESNV